MTQGGAVGATVLDVGAWERRGGEAMTCRPPYCARTKKCSSIGGAGGVVKHALPGTSRASQR
jgi:hypothetical protein